MKTTIVPHATGATRLMLSPSGAHGVAEIRGRWLHEEFPEGDFVPGVLKLLDGEREVVKTAMGWPLGPPSDEGVLLHVEEAPQEYQYRIASSAATEPGPALTPPDGYWHVKAAVGDASCAVVVLWSPTAGRDWKDPAARSDRLWLASFDRSSQKLIASRELSLTTPTPDRGRYGTGVTAGAGLLALVEVPEPDASDTRWRVHALDCATLESRWTTAVAVASDGDGSGSDSRASQSRTPGKLTETVEVATTSTARDERTMKRADLAFSGDGRYLALVYGTAGRAAIGSPTVFVLDGKSGSMLGRIRDGLTHDVHQAVPVAGTSKVALGHLTSFRAGGGSARKTAFYGVTMADLSSRTAEWVIDPKRLEVSGWNQVDSIRAQAIAAHGSAVELAPRSFAWVRDHDGSSATSATWPDDDAATGARRAEVARWMTLPLEWHRPGRDTVKAHDAWMDATRR